ncbi:MAG: hypothetical protein V4594_23100 [Bacteroidota bacterium]
MNKKQYLILLLLFNVLCVNAQVDSTAYPYGKALNHFDYNKPVFRLDSEQLENKNRFLRFVALSGYRPDLKPIKAELGSTWNVSFDKANGTVRAYWINTSIEGILSNGMPANRVLLEVNDPEKFRYMPAYGDHEIWFRKNSRCVEMMFPNGTMNSKVLNMQLANLFNVKCFREKRSINVLVLFRTSSIDKLKSKQLGDQLKGIDGIFSNVSIDWLGENMSDANLPLFVDESGYSGPIDMDLHLTDYSNLMVLRKALQAYDLDLKEEKRITEVFVIRDNDFKGN